MLLQSRRSNSPPVWDPHKKHQIFQAEQIQSQRHAARSRSRFNSYLYELNYNRDRSPGAVLKYLDALQS